MIKFKDKRVNQIMNGQQGLSDKELLKQCLSLLVRLDWQLEKQSPEWYSSSNLIAELNDFYILIDSNEELAEIIQQNR